jgi:metal-responsive CopG/Arc/MetJ family transcriptional regulator
MASQVVKLTISLPRDLLALADEIAAERKISRSKVVYQCLEEMAERRLHLKMAEGYKALAGENLEFANQSINITREILTD